MFNNTTLKRHISLDFHFTSTDNVDVTSKLNGLDIAQLIQCISILILNISVSTLILKQKKLRKKKNNKLFLNLQICHIFISILGTLTIFYPTRLKVIISNGLLIELYLSMIITSTDRFISIKYPFKYQKVRTKTITIAIGIAWIPSVLFVSIAVALNVNQYFCTVLSTILISSATILLSIFNLNIYIIAKRHKDSIMRLIKVIEGNDKQMAKISKSTYVCFAIVFSFIILWMPYLIHNILVLLKSYRPDSENTFTKTVEHVALYNSLIDPLLFVCFSKDVKRELKKVCKMTSSDDMSRQSTLRKDTNETSM